MKINSIGNANFLFLLISLSTFVSTPPCFFIILSLFSLCLLLFFHLNVFLFLSFSLNLSLPLMIVYLFGHFLIFNIYFFSHSFVTAHLSLPSLFLPFVPLSILLSFPLPSSPSFLPSFSLPPIHPCYALQVRISLEREIGKELKEYKRFIDKQILLICGQLDSASKIFDHIYLVSNLPLTQRYYYYLTFGHCFEIVP